MQDLRAVERELARLAIVQLGEESRARDAFRIGCQEPVDLFPQRDAARVDAARQNGRGEIRSAAAERDHFVVGAASEVAGHDDDAAGVEEGETL
jgi:hypothetical protein